MSSIIVVPLYISGGQSKIALTFLLFVVQGEQRSISLGAARVRHVAAANEVVTPSNVVKKEGGITAVMAASRFAQAAVTTQ